MEQKINSVPTQNNDNCFQFDIPSLDSTLAGKAYAMAPGEMHDLVHALKTNLCSDAYVRPLLFTGPSGTGKTTLAQALPVILKKSLSEILALEGLAKHEIEQKCTFFKESDTPFFYKYINGSELGNHYQHSKSQELKKIVRSILDTQKYCVFAVDEANALFSGQKNDNSSQAHETALALKHLFERLEKSKRIITIFTTNYPEQIPQKYGLRKWFLQGNVFHFAQPDQKKQLSALCYHLQKNPNVSINATETDLKKIVDNLNGWSFRRVEALCKEALQSAYIENSASPTITSSRLQEAFNALEEQYRLLQFNKEEPTEQERLCNESLSLQEEFHNNQLRLSKKTMEFHHNAHNVQMVMQLRAHNTKLKTPTYYPPGTHWQYVGGGTDYSGVLSGDTKKALPEHLQSFVTNKKPVDSLYSRHKKEEEKK